jgi:TRAP-type C4-dicarboxylate transport system permease small subunit
MGRAIANAYERLLDGFGVLAGAAIAFLAILVSIDVVIRNLGIGNLPWLLEVAEYGLYVTTFLAAPWALHLGAHVRVDVLVRVVPRPVAFCLDGIADLIGLAASAVLFVHGLEATAASYADGSLLFKELVVTEWYLLAAMPFASTFLIIEFLCRLYRLVTGAAVTEDSLTEGY